ncbi:acyl-CoA N-acyltransferase [Hyaloraphidium curvatum]|nr:acyl-CoA N-acyltransferase [Hyaloraphidium curvatum]
MTSLRRFRADDLFHFNNINLDEFTETYNISFYLTYLAQWPELCHMAVDRTGRRAGYILGKAEGTGKLWHGHVTAVTVAPEFRRLGLARSLMRVLESVCTEVHDAYFVDLFVRRSNALAIGMYEGMGYAVYRRVLGYYSGGGERKDEDAFGGSLPRPRRETAVLTDGRSADMRKALPRDTTRESMVPLKKPITPDELEWW